MYTHFAHHFSRRAPCTLLGCTVAWAVIFTPTAAYADKPTESVGAEMLFDRGQAAMEAGETDRACALFSESLRLDVAVGTLFNLAACEEKQGKLANAWEHYREGVRHVKQGDARVAIAATKIQSLEKRLPWLTVSLAAAAPAGASVTRDGVSLTNVSLGLAWPVNPGAHPVVVLAEGHEPRTVSVTLAEGEHREIVVDAGAALPGAAASAHGGTRTAAWVVGGIGAGALLTGVATGIVAAVNAGEVKDHCDTASGACDPTGLDAHARTKDWSTVSTVAFGATAGLGIASAVLFFVSRDRATRDAAATTTGLAVTPSGFRVIF